MARMIKSESALNLALNIATVFEDGTVIDHKYGLGDVVENLRYVKDEEIKIVSGRITAINYNTPNKVSWNRLKPSDTLSSDITLTNIMIDNSEQYNASTVTVPVSEIVEWEDENTLGTVKRIKVTPKVDLTLTLNYSDNKSTTASIEVGDVFDRVAIIDPSNVGTDIVGKFEVIAFAYKLSNKQFVVTGLALKNVDTEVVGVYDLGYVIGLNEVYIYTPDSVVGLLSVLKGLNGATKIADGDTLTIAVDIDNSTEEGQFQLVGLKDVTVQLDGSVTTANSGASNFAIQNSTVTFTGSGTVKASTAYDKNHSTGVITITTGSDVTFDGPGIDSVLADANAGQFGIVALKDAKVTFNNGEFNGGWYAYSSNGTNGNAPDVTIHGGKFTSAYDYAIYKPDAGTLTIDGDAYIDGLVGAISVNAGSVYISGNPTITTQGANSPVTDTYSDGTSTMETMAAALNLNARYGDVVCRISGGKFFGGDGVTIATGATHNVDLKISGGAFSAPITNENWLEDGYVCSEEKNSDGLYEVVKKNSSESVG